MRSFGKAIEAFCVALALVLIAGTANAQKRDGTLRIPNLDSPASMSIHEEVVSEGPMMPVFNNLVLFDQHVAQNSLQSIVPELATGWSWNDEKTQLKLRRLALDLAHQRNRHDPRPGAVELARRQREDRRRGIADNRVFDILSDGQGDIGANMLPAPEGVRSVPPEMQPRLIASAASRMHCPPMSIMSM
jgi:hypothetical protein